MSPEYLPDSKPAYSLFVWLQLSQNTIRPTVPFYNCSVLENPPLGPDPGTVVCNVIGASLNAGTKLTYDLNAAGASLNLPVSRWESMAALPDSGHLTPRVRLCSRLSSPSPSRLKSRRTRLTFSQASSPRFPEELPR